MYRLVSSSSAAASAAGNLLKSGVLSSPKKSLINGAINANKRLASSNTNHPVAPIVTKTGEKQNFSTAAAEPFLSGSSTSYVEDMYNKWLENPASVHAVSNSNITTK